MVNIPTRAEGPAIEDYPEDTDVEADADIEEERRARSRTRIRLANEVLVLNNRLARMQRIFSTLLQSPTVKRDERFTSYLQSYLQKTICCQMVSEEVMIGVECDVDSVREELEELRKEVEEVCGRF